MNAIANLPGYQITEQLYTGTRTLVYRGIRNSDQQPVVIKLLRNEYPSFNELVQFRNQYTIAKNLDFPGIIKPLNLEVYGNSYALVMEDFGGISLSDYLKPATKESKIYQSLPLEDFLKIAIQLTEILHYLYQNCVIHKDIKPANILINPDTKQIQLIDFSISSLLPRETQEIQNANALEGTLAYLSPEQTGRMNRGIDYRSDFYSLGVTFYEMLTGELPFFSNDPMELVHCHLAKLPIPIEEIQPEIPLVLSHIVRKLMAKNAENRYQSAWGLKYDLEKCLTQLETTGKIEVFSLGERDIRDRFTIPEKLYGRETEVNQLLNAFDRVANGTTEMMLVAGFSGIGKTAVVNEVHKPIVRQRGYFIKGKYDQFQRNIPFSAFVEAFRDLIRQLLSESDGQLQTRKTQILTALGDNGQILIDVIPELEKIIGKQPPASELSGTASQNRFNLLFHKFVQIFTSKEHPLVLFLDDLQWADSASLNLLKSLMEESGYLFILGAYRDNEVSPVHPLLLKVDEIRKKGVIINTITLPPLREADMNRLVADTLNCELSLAEPLTKLVYQKTQGNPFFATQFLKALHDEKLIKFIPSLSNDGNQGGWECDIGQVQALALTDDVVEFMALQLQKLPNETQKMLKLAACIGAQFDLHTLAIVSEKSPISTATALEQALQEGLVIPTTKIYKLFTQSDSNEVFNVSANPTYRFLHDRVQQAAYSLIPNDQKQASHLKIGQLLRQKYSEIEQEEKLFDIVEHLNQGKELIRESWERDQLIQLNLKAGYKAKLSTGYAVASNYLEKGIQLLTEEGWEQHYELMFTLHRERAEVEYLNGNFEQSEALIEVGLNRAKSVLEKAELYHILIIQHSIRGNYATAIETGIHALKLLEVDIDREKIELSINQELAESKKILEDRSISSLLDLPEMDAPEKRMIIQLLIALDPPTYIIADLNLYILIVVKAVNFSMKYGNVPVSAKAYANYGCITGSVLGNYKSGYEFGVLALNLSQKFNHRGQKCQVRLLLGGWLCVWSQPISSAAAINLEGYQDGLLGGEPQFAGYNLFCHICNQLFQGGNLDRIGADIQDYLLFAERTQNQLLIDTLTGIKLFIEPLFVKPNQDAPINHQKFIERSQSSRTLFALSIYYICQMQFACIQQDFDQGQVAMLAIEPILNSVMGFTTSSGYYFY
ncbi:MAG: ATP-binding protein, partial [Microcoleaceae cyanobacterium]